MSRICADMVTCVLYIHVGVYSVCWIVGVLLTTLLHLTSAHHRDNLDARFPAARTYILRVVI